MSMFLNLKSKSPGISPEVAKIELTELLDEGDVVDAVRSMNALGFPNETLTIYEVGNEEIEAYEVEEFLANAIR
jgi:hypothetical protein